MEVDGGIAFGRLNPAERVLASMPTGYASCREVDQDAMQVPGRDIDHAIGGNANREVPRGDQIHVTRAPGLCIQLGDHVVGF